MTICKYFQQGTCRYGSRCRFEHTYGGGGGAANGYGPTSGTSVFNRNKTTGQFSAGGFFSQATPAVHQVVQRPSAPVPELRDLVQMVVTELIQSERGGQWPLSCFAPFKEQGCFPGLEDHAPEEIRQLMYEGAKTGNLEDCSRTIKELYNRNSIVKKQILNPTQEVCSIVEKLFKGQPIEQSASNSLFGSQVGGTGGSIFSQVPTDFTFSLTPGGGTSVPNNFGSSQSIFGNNGGSAVTSSSIFGIPGQIGISTNQNIFGGASQTVVASPFGSSTPVSSVFQQAPMFSEQSKAVFGNSVLTQNKGVFGGSTAGWNQPGKTVGDDTVFTPLSELSEDEKSFFSSKTFTMGKVPINAPAKELCS